MDVEYYGPNPQMGLWYLGALKAAEAMARHLGDTSFADTCLDLFSRGSTNWFELDEWELLYIPGGMPPVLELHRQAAKLRLHDCAEPRLSSADTGPARSLCVERRHAEIIVLTSRPIAGAVSPHSTWALKCR